MSDLRGKCTDFKHVNKKYVLIRARFLRGFLLFYRVKIVNLESKLVLEGKLVEKM
jgi:hypothetical protein